MGFFSDIVNETRQGGSPGVSCVLKPSEPPAPASAQPEPPAMEVAADTDAEEAKRRQAHEAAEAQRRAEWEAKQQAKRAAEQGELDRLAAMGDEDAAAAAARRVSEDTEKLTGRSMKESVAAHIREACRTDPAFARLTLHPRKSMLHCIQYISRQARDYLEKELAAEGVKPGGVYGGDVPDGLCYQWAEDYFRDPDAKEDQASEDKFVPKPYIGTVRSKPKPKPTKAQQKEKAQEAFGQLSLLGEPLCTRAKSVCTLSPLWVPLSLKR